MLNILTITFHTSVINVYLIFCEHLKNLITRHHVKNLYNIDVFTKSLKLINRGNIYY